MTTTRRRGSSPSLDEITPSTVPTASWITLRSNGFITASLTGSPVRSTGSAVSRPSRPAPRGAGHEAGDVEHQPRALPGLRGRRQAAELLERLQHLAVVTDQAFNVTATDDRDDRPLALDIQVDVAVVVQDVQQAFEVVAGRVALGDQEVVPALPGPA